MCSEIHTLITRCGVSWCSVFSVGQLILCIPNFTVSGTRRYLIVEKPLPYSYRVLGSVHDDHSASERFTANWHEHWKMLFIHSLWRRRCDSTFGSMYTLTGGYAIARGTVTRYHARLRSTGWKHSHGDYLLSYFLGQRIHHSITCDSFDVKLSHYEPLDSCFHQTE